MVAPGQPSVTPLTVMNFKALEGEVCDVPGVHGLTADVRLEALCVHDLYTQNSNFEVLVGPKRRKDDQPLNAHATDLRAPATGSDSAAASNEHDGTASADAWVEVGPAATRSSNAVGGVSCAGACASARTRPPGRPSATGLSRSSSSSSFLSAGTGDEHQSGATDTFFSASYKQQTVDGTKKIAVNIRFQPLEIVVNKQLVELMSRLFERPSTGPQYGLPEGNLLQPTTAALRPTAAASYSLALMLDIRAPQVNEYNEFCS